MDRKKYLTIVRNVVLGLLVIAGISMFAYLQGTKKQTSTTTDPYLDVGRDIPIKSGCFRTDVDFTDFSYHVYPYEEYVVIPGDNLIEIAEKSLGDPARAHEFILLNTDRYPWLQSQPETLEVGMKLRVPPKDITVTGGPETINRFLGQLVYITENQMAMRDQPTDHHFFLYPNAQTRYLDGENIITQNQLTTDVCVEVVLGSEGVNTPKYVRIVR
jgi:hypothetical protein